MSYPINYPTPQGANVQIFVNGGGVPNTAGGASVGSSFDWVKPQAASFVWFTLIGAGGDAAGATGGGSGAVTNFMCPAFLIPDVLRVNVAPNDNSGVDTEIRYQQKDGSGYLLLAADSGGGGVAGVAFTANAFTAMGFFQSIAGQAGSSGTQSASTTTFLSGGANSSGTLSANYGYSLPTGTNSGFFQMQPIIVGLGGIGLGKGGIGCGGGSGISNTKGGSGMVVIITW